MKPLLATGAILAATCGWLSVLFAARPFEHANTALDRAFGALPPWTQVDNLYRDPRMQDVSRGDHPLESFEILRQTWAGHPAATRIVLMGNSQTQAVSLAPGEPPPSGPEKTYTDHIADRYREAGSRALFYRLAAGALSYQEMLWYGMYLAGRREIRPDVLLVQLNYQNFANEGIRAGMLEMLGDRGFRSGVEALVRAGRPESDAFAEALRQFTARPDAPSRRPDRGEVIETALRTKLDSAPGFGERYRLKESFVLMLLRCRSYILHLEPGSRRSLGGPRVAASRAALEDLLDLCRRSGTRAVLFQAPTNPAVPLYKTEDDDRSYHAFVTSLAARYAVPVLDFEHAVPAALWGQELNGPDPLHLGRRGHLRFASLLLDALGKRGL
jgi:hypothetical protein